MSDNPKADNAADGGLRLTNCSLSFQDWWNDQENGCPSLVLDNDEQFARAVWNAAIKSTENNATRNIQPAS